MKYRNKKNGNIYIKVSCAINCTNNQDGQHMIVYRENKKKELYVREESEFFVKFEKINNK